MRRNHHCKIDIAAQFCGRAATLPKSALTLQLHILREVSPVILNGFCAEKNLSFRGLAIEERGSTEPISGFLVSSGGGCYLGIFAAYVRNLLGAISKPCNNLQGI